MKRNAKEDLEWLDVPADFSAIPPGTKGDIKKIKTIARYWITKAKKLKAKSKANSKQQKLMVDQLAELAKNRFDKIKELQAEVEQLKSSQTTSENKDEVQ